MSTLADLTEIVGFFSYSRDDDEAFQGTLSALRDGIQRELAAQLGRSKRTFRLWQDQVAIAPGKFWESEIKKAVEESVFFIPIVTPRAVNSKYCKFEFESFLAREKALFRDDLVFPILYIPVAVLEDESKWRGDLVLSTIGARQYVDWRPLRHLDVQTTAVREKIEGFCRQIVKALNEPWTSPEERRMEEAKARQQAEEVQKAQRLEAEAKRRAEEEQYRKEAEEETRRRSEERRKQAESKALEVEARRKATEEAEARPKVEREPPSAQPSPQAPSPQSVTTEQTEQLEHVPSEQPEAAAVRSPVPWRIMAGSAITLGVIAIAALWRLAQPPVTSQAPPPVTPRLEPQVTQPSQPAPPLTPQLAPPATQPVPPVTQSAPPVTRPVPQSAPPATPQLEPPVTQPSQPAPPITPQLAPPATQPVPPVTPQLPPPVTAQDASAMYSQGESYYGSQNYAKARESYENAAAKDNADAMFKLGVLYANGQGVARDYAKAREWYEKAAAKDDASAMFNLGLLYHNGQGVAQDNAKAREWYEKAAAKDNTTAMLNLAVLYHNGQGVARNYAKAREWLNKAADRGDVHAKALLKQTVKQRNHALGGGIPRPRMGTRESTTAKLPIIRERPHFTDQRGGIG